MTFSWYKYKKKNERIWWLLTSQKPVAFVKHKNLWFYIFFWLSYNWNKSDMHICFIILHSIDTKSGFRMRIPAKNGGRSNTCEKKKINHGNRTCLLRRLSVHSINKVLEFFFFLFNNNSREILRIIEPKGLLPWKSLLF